jgi:exonuclease SbcD
VDDNTGLTISQLDAQLQDAVEKILNDLASQANISNAPRVLTGHFTVTGAALGSERQIMLGRDVAIMLSALARPEWDYVAMGHIHKFQDLTEKYPNLPPVVYSGSLERVDFGEEADQKGFVWVELERGQTRYDFVPLRNARPFLTLRVDVRGMPNPTEYVLDVISGYHLSEAIVRVLITTDEESDPLLKIKDIEQALKQRGANYIASIQRQVERPARLRLGTNPEGLTAPELLEKYLRSRSVPQDRIHLLLEAAETIFRAAVEAV